MNIDDYKVYVDDNNYDDYDDYDDYNGYSRE